MINIPIDTRTLQAHTARVESVFLLTKTCFVVILRLRDKAVMNMNQFAVCIEKTNHGVSNGL